MYEATSQVRYRCRLEWGCRGVELAVFRGDVLVVVDTLRFSTAAIAAIHHGAVIYPCAPSEEAAVLARHPGAAVASLGERARFSLSPASYEEVEPGRQIVLPSPNGATCSQYGHSLPHLFIGALINASAVSAAVESIVKANEQGVTVLACGERRWPAVDEDTLRFALEDYLGAGAIIAGIDLDKSPEAVVCEAAFLGNSARLQELMWNCVSGWELREKGLGDDVRLAATLDMYDTVPVMSDDRLLAFAGEAQR